MANLLSVCELSWRQMFPNPSDDTPITVDEFIETGQAEAAYQIWLQMMAEKREDGYVDVPSYLLNTVELEVKDNEIDLCNLKVFRSLTKDTWLQGVGSPECGCDYIKTTLNLSRLLCDENDRGHGFKTYYPVGKKIKFPQGTHAKTLPITYASSGGENINDEIEISDEIAAMVRTRLIEIYGGRTGTEDVTDNKTPNG